MARQAHRNRLPMPPVTSRRAARAARVGLRLLPVLIWSALHACGSPEATVPAEPPYIRGVVTSRGESEFLVEEDPERQAGSAKALLRLTPATAILWGSGDAADRRDLRLGVKVRVWVDGPVLESYPVQATAGTVVIDLGTLQIEPQG